MKRLLATFVFLLVPVQSFAKDQLRRFRWAETQSTPRRLLVPLALGSSEPAALPGVGERVVSEPQRAGSAVVEGAWRQSIYGASGQLVYTAGALADELPSADWLRRSEAALAATQEVGMARAPQLRGASRVFPPKLTLKKDVGDGWRAVWRVEYLGSAADGLRFLELDQSGAVAAEGELEWSGVDGRAMVFPRGPLLGGAEERPLPDLNGDGTLSGRLLRVTSALDLNVWSPQFTFFYAQDDRRFDLGQAYYTLSQGFRWLKDRLGVEVRNPLDVRLHVGEGGVSNAAFYHENTIYLGTGDGVVYKDLIRDPSVLIHEGIHALIDSYAGLPSEGEGGGFNEGFADLFTALILDNPRVGEASYIPGPYRRTLEHSLQAYRDFRPGVYQNGSIVAATFWDMRAFLGTERTAQLAFRTLVRLGRGARFDDLPAALEAAGEGLLTPEQKTAVRQAARARGWIVP